jgi:hypothetical protein
MRYYRVHVLDDSSRITAGFDLHCEDNQTACKEASRLCMGRQWELWSGAERILCKAHETKPCPQETVPQPESNPAPDVSDHPACGGGRAP